MLILNKQINKQINNQTAIRSESSFTEGEAKAWSRTYSAEKLEGKEKGGIEVKPFTSTCTIPGAVQSWPQKIHDSQSTEKGWQS